MSTRGDEKHQSSSIRWPADLKAEIEQLARADDRNFSSYVIATMRAHVAALKQRAGKRS